MGCHARFAQLGEVRATDWTPIRFVHGRLFSVSIPFRIGDDRYAHEARCRSIRCRLIPINAKGTISYYDELLNFLLREEEVSWPKP
jgi:hypothetical protein